MSTKQDQLKQLNDLLEARRSVYPVHPREIMAIGQYAAEEWVRRRIEAAWILNNEGVTSE